MTKEVQLAGGTSETQDAYIGPARELTVDTSNQELRLHDGVTPGGRKIINRDAGDERWQAKNGELDNFSFASQLKGFVARVSPGTYRIRTLTVNGDNLTITNPSGTAGNPYIELATTILSDHTWDGQQTFVDIIKAEGGVEGDLLGNVLGNVVGNLTGNANGDHTGSFTGDVDTEGHTLNMGDGQIELAWLSAAIQQLWIDRGLPYGTIIGWSGAADAIPESFFLCDGDNGTPDLRGKFLLGAGGAFAVGATGGSATHAHTGTVDSAGAHVHQGGSGPHALTVAELPAHKHGNGVCDAGTAMYNHGSFAASPSTSDSIDNNSQNGVNEGYTTEVGEGDAHSHSAADTTSNGAHQHTFISDSASSMPPYYAYCYIMKGV